MESHTPRGFVAVEGICPECGSAMGRDLHRHLFNVHSYSKDDIQRLKKQKRSFKVLSAASEVHTCDVCGLPYTSKQALARHKKEKGHNYEEQPAHPYFSCPLCGQQVTNHWDLINHVNEEHATLENQYIVETATFEDKAKFEEWKNQLENDYVVRFAAATRRKLSAGFVTYMRCSRARPSRAYQDIERPGSRKVAECCTAFMKVTETGNHIKVKFCRSHCGHEVQPALLSIDSKSEQYIVSLLREGFRPHQILKKIRAECRENDSHLRLYYVSYSDIRLIGIRNKVDPSRRDDVDIRSVEMRVQEKAPEDGIRVYTPAVNDTGEGFSLVIITPVQESWLAKYGARAICMDDTFNLTSYCLRLATVIVVDEWDRGLPGAYLLSNRMTENEVASMFEEVKNLLPSFDTDYFMSDDCNSFYNGFVKVFPQSRAQKLLCSFHVIQAVKRNCHARLKQKEITENVLASVRSLCKTSDPNVFASRYASLLTFLNSQGEKNLTDYFEKTWSPRIQQWGGFARRNASVGTSMLIERFHRRLKHEVSNTKSNMRIDTLMEILISLVPSMEEDRRIMMARGLRAGRYRLTQNHRAHALAVKLFGCNQEDISILEEGLWTVTDRRGVHYVEQQFCLCDAKVNNHCSKCNACAYAFLCDCPQDARAGISCAHIHAALLYAPEGMLPAAQHSSSSLTAEETARRTTTASTDNYEDGVMYVDETRAQNERLYRSRTTTDMLDTNKELLQEFESVSAALRSKMVTLSKVAHEGAQQQMKKLIEMMKNMDVEASSEIALHRAAPSSPQLARRVDLALTGRPPNYAPIRLAKRASLRRKPKVQEQRPVEEFNPDDIQCCIICFRRIPDDNSDRDFDEWVKCSTCGLWAHESCSGEGTPCPYDEGTFNCSS